MLAALLVLALLIALLTRPRGQKMDTRAQFDLEAQHGVTHTDPDRFCAAIAQIRGSSRRAIAAARAGQTGRLATAVRVIDHEVTTVESAAATLPQAGDLDALLASRENVVQAAQSTERSTAQNQVLVQGLVDVSLKAKLAGSRAGCPTSTS